MLSLSETLTNLHSSFDFLKAELLSQSSSVRTPSASCGPELADSARSESTCDKISAVSSSATAVDNWKRKFLEKDSEIHRMQQHINSVELQLEDHTTTQQQLKCKLTASIDAYRTLEGEVARLKQALASEQKSHVVAAEQLTRTQSQLSKLSSTKDQWITWTDTLEAQVTATREAVARLAFVNGEQAHRIAALECTESELERLRGQFASSETQRQIAQAELAAVRRCGSEFQSSLDDARKLLEQGAAAVATFLELRDQLEQERLRAEARAEESDKRCQQLLLELIAIRPPMISAEIQTEENHHALPSEGTRSERDDEENCDTARSRQDALEARMISLTLKLTLMREERDSLQEECTSLKRILSSPLFANAAAATSAPSNTHHHIHTNAADESNAMIESSAATKSPKEDLTSAVTSHTNAVQELCRLLEAIQTLAADPFSKCTTTSPQHWHQLVEEVQHEMMSQHETIRALRSQLAQNRGCVSGLDLGPIRSRAQHPAVTHPIASVSTEDPRPQPECLEASHHAMLSSLAATCGICGRASESTSSAADWCKCRLCGDAFHRRCCHQSEALFVCHRHSAGDAAPPAAYQRSANPINGVTGRGRGARSKH